MASVSCTNTRVTVRFADVLLSTPIAVNIAHPPDSRFFAYALRNAIQREKRVAPINQCLNKLDEYHYELRIRRRSASLSLLTIHGSNSDEYDVYVDTQDTVMDLKYLLAPLIDAKPEHIQLNYNTQRRLHDHENVMQANCLSADIVIMFWLEIPTQNMHESPIIRSVSHLISTNPMYPDMGSTLRKACRTFAGSKRHTFGVRQYLDCNDSSKRGEYKWIDYDTLNERVTRIASGFRQFGLIPHKSKIAIGSENRTEWLLADYAASVQSLVSVPLYSVMDTLISHILKHAEIECVVCSAAMLPQVNKARAHCAKLRYIVLMDDELPDQIYAKQTDVARKTYTHLLSEVEALGTRQLFDDVLPKTDDLFTIMYTSGTTGPPKGVMITHQSFMCFMHTAMQVDLSEKYNIDKATLKHLSYLPFAHHYERAVSLINLLRGIPTGFWSGTADALLDDMRILKPINFFGVPRTFQKVQDGIMERVNASNFLVRAMFKYAFNQKLQAIKHRRQPSAFWENIVFNKLRQAFGGNIKFCATGSAPVSESTQHFLKVCLFEVVSQAYGSTESGSSGCITTGKELKYGQVGPPGSNVEMKLVSVPEMDYTVADEPEMRGEIYLRGPAVFSGYFKDPQKTQQVLSADGWFATGDIGKWRDEGRLEVIDRKKHLFKLAQGEYIRPEYIQTIYKLARFIANCFVTGDSLQTYLVAIVVPDFHALCSFINDANNGLLDLKNKSKEEIIADERIVRLIAECMREEEQKAELKGFEKVKKFVLKAQDFTRENGLLTDSMKLKRNVARKRFAKEVDALYAKKSKL